MSEVADDSGNLEVVFKQFKVRTWVQRFETGWWCCIGLFPKSQPESEPERTTLARGPFDTERECRHEFKHDFTETFMADVRRLRWKMGRDE